MKNKLVATLFVFSSLLVLSNCNSISNKETKTEDNQITEKEYLEKGREMAMQAQSVLGKNLKNAIKEKGTDGALSFCNENAIPLTDSMAKALNVLIKRVSDQNRNKNNAANKMELEYIQNAKLDLQKNKAAKPQLTEIDGKMVGYYPIMTNPMCLNCHGDPKVDINAKTYQVLQEAYPNDKAMGYLSNELRGIWVIEMDK